jgi:alpha-beta hydrolase superfamily lysophospholipase
VIDIPSKGEASTRTLYFEAPNPKATVLLFIGGDGQLKLTDDGQTGSRHTFVRSIERWASHGINAVLVDSPSDLGNAKKGHKRNSEDHLNRVSEVISFYQQNQGKPVWIFGHSMGTSTVAALMNSGRPEVSQLSGYIVAGTLAGESIPSSVKLPALGIHHQRDGCPKTPVGASKAIIDLRSDDTVKGLVLLTGGQERGNPCFAQSYHGFLGVEDEFIDSAAKFIIQNSRLPN